MSKIMHVQLHFTTAQSGLQSTAPLGLGLKGSGVDCSYANAETGAQVGNFRVSKSTSIVGIERIYANLNGTIKPYTGLGIPALVIKVEGVSPYLLGVDGGHEVVVSDGPTNASQLAALAKLALKLNP